MTDKTRYITTWRKTAAMGSVLEWDHYVSENLQDAARVVKSIQNQGVHQFHTYELGPLLSDLSSEY